MKQISIYLQAFLYVVAGINHFINTKMYMRIMPAWMPWHLPVVFISGVLEISLGLLLLPVITRPYAAWGIIVLLIAVFPANVQMMFNYQETQNPRLWLASLRLPLQFVLIWWAWQLTK